MQAVEKAADSWILRLGYPAEYQSLVVVRGSIGVDGVSLTVAELEGEAVRIAVIPHTLGQTILPAYAPGLPVNLEFDIIGKYIARWLETSRGSSSSPLTLDRLKDLGAVFGHKNGWERANYFEPGKPGRQAGAEQQAWGWARPSYSSLVGEEVQAARERVALFDMTSFGKIDVRGQGALALLQKLAANDLDRPVGSITYTQFLNHKGGIESDVTVTRVAENEFRIISGTSFVSSDLGWMQLHLPDDGSVAIEDVTDRMGCLGLWGPQAREVLQAVSPTDRSEERRVGRECRSRWPP